MQDVTTKLARVRSAKPEGWTDDDLRRLIHGVGGSPRRAKRLLRSNVELAAHLRDAYASDINGGMAHAKAVGLAGERYLSLSDGGDAAEMGDDEVAEALEAEPAPAPIPAKRQRRSLSDMAAQLAG